MHTYSLACKQLSRRRRRRQHCAKSVFAHLFQVTYSLTHHHYCLSVCLGRVVASLNSLAIQCIAREREITPPVISAVGKRERGVTVDGGRKRTIDERTKISKLEAYSNILIIFTKLPCVGDPAGWPDNDEDLRKLPTILLL